MAANILLRMLLCCVLLLVSGVSRARDATAVESLLRADYSSVIIDGVRNQLRKHLDSGTLSPEKIRRIVHHPELEQLCHIGQFFRYASQEKAFSTRELRDRTFTRWLVSHPEVFRKLAHAGYAQQSSLAILYRLWNSADRDLCGVDLNIALGACLIADVFTAEECIARYGFYHDSHHHGRCYPQADSLEPWEWAVVLRGKESLEDLAWAQQFIEGKNIKPEQAGGKFTGFIPYRKKNHRGISIHAGAAFYDNKPITLQLYTEYGGVCGAVSKGAAGFVKAKGIPSYTIGQPGHCAFVWKGIDGEWKIGNNIYGWVWSEGGSGGPWKGAVSTITELPRFWKKNAAASNLCYYLSLLAADPQKAGTLLKEALKRNASNYPAWQALTKRNAKRSEKEKLVLLEQFKEAFSGNPTMWEYFLKKELGLDWKKANGYAVYPGLLAENESWDSVDAYMRNFCALARRDIPDMAGKLSYEVKTKRIFFKNWLKFYKQNKVDRKVRVQTCAVLEKALPPLLTHEKTALQFLGFYGQILDLWKDKQLSARADACLTAWLKEADKAPVRKKVAEIGLKVATHLEDKRALVRYAEAQEEH